MANKSNKKQTGLGKGLGALLGQTEQQFKQEYQTVEKVVNLNIDEISPNKEQPRKEFDSEKISELADSIKENGVLQPIIVIKKENPDYYMIIAGERRWRASREAGLKTIPSIIRKMEEHLVLQHSIIENIQRENLNPVDEAMAYQQLMDQYNFTQEEMAKKLGKSRSAIANMLRLNRLPAEVSKELADGTITIGHARCLLALPSIEDQIDACETILQEEMNVRQTEKYIKSLLEPTKKTKKSKNRLNAYLLNIKKIEDELSKSLGTKVKLKDKQGKGLIQINYSDNDELERILEILK